MTSRERTHAHARTHTHPLNQKKGFELKQLTVHPAFGLRERLQL